MMRKLLLLAALGGEVSIDRGEDADVMTVHAKDIRSTTAPYEIVSQIRASSWVGRLYTSPRPRD